MDQEVYTKMLTEESKADYVKSHLMDYEVRKLKDLSKEEKWDILMHYLKSSLSHKQIGEMYALAPSSVEDLIGKLYDKFRNTRESKALEYMPHQSSHITEVIRSTFFNSDDINSGFLKRLSPEDEMLTDHELLFCEFFNELGDEVKAIERARLSLGLSKNDKASFTEGCRLRAMYLKRKENVRSYLYELRKRNLEVLNEDGKSYIQSNLIQLIEQLSRNGDRGSLTSQLKAIEHLGRSIGAFEDKVTVESVNGDEVLDRIIAKAKEAHLARAENLIEQEQD